MDYNNFTWTPRGHKTYAEIKDLSENLQHEKMDFLTKGFVSKLSESIYLENKPNNLKDLKEIYA